MSNFVIALLLTLGISTWIFSKVQYRSGQQNNRQTLTVTAVAAVLVFILSFGILSLVF